VLRRCTVVGARLHLPDRVRQRRHESEDCLVDAARKEAQLRQISQILAVCWVLPPNDMETDEALQLRWHRMLSISDARSITL